MIKPMYFVEDVVSYKAKNKAQQFVEDMIGDIKFKTFEDVAALGEFEYYLNHIVDEANDKFPHCSNLAIHKCTNLENQIEFDVVVPAKEGEISYVMIFTIAINRGEWKGGNR